MDKTEYFSTKRIFFFCFPNIYIYILALNNKWFSMSLYSNNLYWIDDGFCCVTTRQQLIPKIYFLFLYVIQSELSTKWNNRRGNREKRNRITAQPFNGFITIWKHVSLVSLRNINEHSVKSLSQSFNFINLIFCDDLKFRILWRSSLHWFGVKQMFSMKMNLNCVE